MSAHVPFADDPERHLTLRQADQAAGFCAIQEDLDLMQGQLAKLPGRAEIWTIALILAGGDLAAFGIAALLLVR